MDHMTRFGSLMLALALSALAAGSTTASTAPNLHESGAVAAGKDIHFVQGRCQRYGKSQHCNARWDRRTGTCVCSG
jgi:hypothetical protein